MAHQLPDCVLCQPELADATFRRIPVWEDEHWRLTTSLYSEIPGFSYLEPKRHIPNISDLDGTEASSLGSVLARVTTALRDVLNAERVNIYVFGGHVDHLHLHLAPHVEGDACNEAIVTDDAQLVPETELIAVANRVQKELSRNS